MSIKSMQREASKTSLNFLDILKESYMASMSTVYGGQEGESEIESADDASPRYQPPPPPLITSGSAQKIRRALRFFFMNPIQKWHSRRRIPWKLFIQVLKIAFVTAQLCIFAKANIFHMGYVNDTGLIFSNLFLKGWKKTDEVLSYPPNGGPLAIYKQSEFYQSLDYAISNFGQIHNVSTGTYGFIQLENGTLLSPTFCVTQYECSSSEEPNGYVCIVNAHIRKKCIIIPISAANSSQWSLQVYLNSKDFTINFSGLLEAEFDFQLKAIALTAKPPNQNPTCHMLSTSVVFTNDIGGSQMTVDLNLDIQNVHCQGHMIFEHPRKTMKLWNYIMDVLVIVVCTSSLALCIRSLHNARVLKHRTSRFFKDNIGRPLTPKESRQFLNMWYVLMCVNDALLIVGSFFSLGLEAGKYINNAFLWSVCSLFLGLGNMLTWIGALRYLGFFETYNVMILTLKKCTPNVLRLSICILLIFFGYTFCGWVVLGPYHFKFQTFLSSMECLYSLINGDDMFASFFSTSGLDPLIWYFSRIYLYTFISLFMWVILSIFLAVIMDAYEMIKSYYEIGFPRTGLMKFVMEQDAGSGHSAWDEKEHTIHDTLNSLCCCMRE